MKKIFLIGLFCLLSACGNRSLPTAEECKELLNSDRHSQAEIDDFIRRSQDRLRNLSDVEREGIEAERLGLCTGALMRRNQSP